MKRKTIVGDTIMTKDIILRNASSSSSDKKQPLLDYQDFSSRGKQPTPATCSCGTRVAEVVGGATADCAAVCCCCPCGLVNLVVLAVYKLPAGLYRKALRKKRRRRMIKNGLAPDRSYPCDEPELLFRSTSMPMSAADKDVLALEEEMWGKFYSSGFWRSPSQRSEVM